jgi:hypothetical protein
LCVKGFKNVYVGIEKLKNKRRIEGSTCANLRFRSVYELGVVVCDVAAQTTVHHCAVL